MSIDIYTDGAYSSSRDQGGVGIVFLIDGKLHKKYQRMFKHTTNNQMEMCAVIIALRSIKTNCDKIVIHSDSQYVIGCATKGWKRKKNVELWGQYDEAYKMASSYCPDISFTWVHGHSGDEFNEMCDKLAVNASQEYEIT